LKSLRRYRNVFDCTNSFGFIRYSLSRDFVPNPSYFLCPVTKKVTKKRPDKTLPATAWT
jgi:hypothetical protein